MADDRRWLSAKDVGRPYAGWPTWMVIGLATVLAGCSTGGLRGNTQSASLLEDRPYSQPYYSGSRERVPLKSTPNDVRYHSDYRQPVSGVSGRGYSTDLTRPTGEQIPRRPYRSANLSPPVRYAPNATPNFAPKRSIAPVAPVARVPERSPPLHQRPVRSRPVKTQPVLRNALDTRPNATAAPRVEGPPRYKRTGWARWMGPSWVGHQTSSGELFDPARLTAAHESLPIPSFLYVTNQANGRTVLVRVNDRVAGDDQRVVIVSKLAADLLGFSDLGRAKVDLQHGGPAAKEPNAKHEDAFLRRQPWFHRGLLHDTVAGKGNAGKLGAPSTRYASPTYPRWDDTKRDGTALQSAPAR